MISRNGKNDERNLLNLKLSRAILHNSGFAYHYGKKEREDLVQELIEIIGWVNEEI